MAPLNQRGTSAAPGIRRLYLLSLVLMLGAFLLSIGQAWSADYPAYHRPRRGDAAVQRRGSVARSGHCRDRGAAGHRLRTGDALSRHALGGAAAGRRHPARSGHRGRGERRFRRDPPARLAPAPARRKRFGPLSRHRAAGFALAEAGRQELSVPVRSISSGSGPRPRASVRSNGPMRSSRSAHRICRQSAGRYWPSIPNCRRRTRAVPARLSMPPCVSSATG